MTIILGISAFYHDSAAALVVDGDIVAAAQEERFTRVKHDHRFPENAVNYCLSSANIHPEAIDYVGFYEKPIAKFDRLLETYLAFAPSGYRSFRQAIPLWIKQKLHHPRELKKGLRGAYRKRFVFPEHHESHAASAFFPSPFERAAILTLDGVGEWATTCLGIGISNRIELTHELRFPHSLGLLYSAFTYYTGFRVNSGEYKLMGLAPYGTPIYKQIILENLMELREDGSFRMDMSYFRYCQGLTMTSEKFHRLFGALPRDPQSDITQREMDIAASIQAITEEVILRIANHLHQLTKMDNLVMAGGVSLNCVGNGRLLREGPFKNIWVQPAAGDAGGALGTALFIWHQLLRNPRVPLSTDSQKGSYLGPEFDEFEIISAIERHGATYHRYESEDAMCESVAELISEEKVIGWFQGRMEFGPRALGARSILGDPRSPMMQSLMNLKIKFRESFRPFAPLILREYIDQYFQAPKNLDSPYMLFVAPLLEKWRYELSAECKAAFGIDKLKFARSSLPAITHVDYSARIQTVDSQRNPLLHKLMRRFQQKTGCPLLINTSFNVRSEPIVCSPDDAIRCFQMTDIDALVLGPYILHKHLQPNQTSDSQRATHLAQFRPD